MDITKTAKILPGIGKHAIWTKALRILFLRDAIRIDVNISQIPPAMVRVVGVPADEAAAHASDMTTTTT